MACVVQNPINYYHYGMGEYSRLMVKKASVPAPPPSKCLSSAPSLSPLAAYRCCRRPHLCRLPISCSKRAAPADESAERRSISAQPRDDVTNAETPRAHSSLQDAQQHQDYASSVRTVAFWVRISLLLFSPFSAFTSIYFIIVFIYFIFSPYRFAPL